MIPYRIIKPEEQPKSECFHINLFLYSLLTFYFFISFLIFLLLDLLCLIDGLTCSIVNFLNDVLFMIFLLVFQSFIILFFFDAFRLHHYHLRKKFHHFDFFSLVMGGYVHYFFIFFYVLSISMLLLRFVMLCLDWIHWNVVFVIYDLLGILIFLVLFCVFLWAIVKFSVDFRRRKIGLNEITSKLCLSFWISFLCGYNNGITQNYMLKTGIAPINTNRMRMSKIFESSEKKRIKEEEGRMIFRENDDPEKRDSKKELSKPLLGKTENYNDDYESNNDNIEAEEEKIIDIEEKNDSKDDIDSNNEVLIVEKENKNENNKNSSNDTSDEDDDENEMIL